jgi:hypothetical protein
MQPQTALPAPGSHEQRTTLAGAVSRLFDLWALNTADRLALLGFSESNRTALQRYARGEALAASRDLSDRVGHLLGIHKSLKLLYPRNQELVHTWMAAPNTRFGGNSPITVVRKFGLPGLVMVRGTLDIMRGQ